MKAGIAAKVAALFVGCAVAPLLHSPPSLLTNELRFRKPEWLSFELRVEYVDSIDPQKYPALSVCGTRSDPRVLVLDLLCAFLAGLLLSRQPERPRSWIRLLIALVPLHVFVRMGHPALMLRGSFVAAQEGFTLILPVAISMGLMAWAMWISVGVGVALGGHATSKASFARSSLRSTARMAGRDALVTLAPAGLVCGVGIVLAHLHLHPLVGLCIASLAAVGQGLLSRKGAWSVTTLVFLTSYAGGTGDFTRAALAVDSALPYVALLAAWHFGMYLRPEDAA